MASAALAVLEALVAREVLAPEALAVSALGTRKSSAIRPKDLVG